MPWVRLDDRFPSHRKVALLSDRAFRLYISALCWASENLTEGRITTRELPVVARVRGLKAAARELEEAGLWDKDADGWVIHDYLEYNPDRARVKADREANAARQKAWRERKKAEREAKRAAEEAARNAHRNGVTLGASGAGNDATATRTRHDDDTTTPRRSAEETEEPQVNAIRNGVSNGAPSRPVLPLPTGEEEEETASCDEPRRRRDDQPQIPDASQPLVAALGAERLFVGWELTDSEWLLIEALIKRCGIPALVTSARASWEGARKTPRSGRYFIPAWRQLPATPEDHPGSDVVPFPTPGSRSTAQQQSDDMFDRAMARARARMQQENQ